MVCLSVRKSICLSVTVLSIEVDASAFGSGHYADVPFVKIKQLLVVSKKHGFDMCATHTV